MRFWRAGTGHVRGGGQYDLMESVSAKGGFEPASELTSKQVRSKIESYGFGLRSFCKVYLFVVILRPEPWTLDPKRTRVFLLEKKTLLFILAMETLF